MVLTLDDTRTIQGALWNGTGFDNGTNISLSVDAQENNEINFDFVWEGQTEEGLAVYADPQGGGAWAYRTYNLTSKAWSAQQVFFTLNSGNAQKVKLCGHHNSSLVGFMSKDSSNDMNVRIWNGTNGSVDAGFPTEEASTEDNPNGAGSFDCAFETNGTQIVFGYVDLTNSVDDRIHHFYYDMDTAQWSIAAIDDANSTDILGAGGGVIEALEFIAHPLTEEIMAVAMLNANDIDVALWNGTNFTMITTNQPELTAECNAGSQVCAGFDWFRNDPVPDITQIAPVDGTSGNLGEAVTIQANVTDNLAVDTVILNVSLPNGSTRQYTLLQTDGLYQVTFNDTNGAGQHDFVFIANDTSRHQNVNITNVSYTTGDTEEPNVTLIVGNGTFEVGTKVNITANVTDDTAVDTVRVNLTFPNGSTLLLTPENLTGEHHVNITITIDMSFGVHNFTIIANDTANNINNSITNSFNYTDISIPQVSALTVEPDTANQSDTLNITATIDENGKVSTAQANVTFSNGSSVLLAMTNDSTTFNVSYATELFHEQGTYNISIVVNDTNDNVNNTIYTEVTVNDVTVPTLNLLLPANSTTFMQDENVTVRVNATDNRNVSVVRVNVTQPNGNFTEFNLSKEGELFEINYTNTSQLGVYNFTILTNDTSDNEQTQPNFFEILNSTKPSVTLLTADNIGSLDDLDLECNVTTSNTLANITLYTDLTGSFVANETRNLSGGSNVTTFVIGGVTDQSLIWNCLAADNVAEGFAIANFTAHVDTTGPVVVNDTPANGQEFAAGSVVAITANITDNNLSIDQAILNITRPDGSTRLHNMTSGTPYEVNITNTSALGVYTYNISANDTLDNIGTAQRIFNVTDSQPPEVLALTAVPFNAGNQVELNQSANISVNVSDGVAVDKVLANVTFPDATNEVFNLTVHEGSRYNLSFANTTQAGLYNITILANDTADQQNHSIKANFTVNDTRPPAVLNITTLPRLLLRTNLTNITARVLDEGTVDVAVINLTFINLTSRDSVMTSFGDIYNLTFTPEATAPKGVYNISILANDTNNNLNQTVRFNSSFILAIEFSPTTTLPVGAEEGHSQKTNTANTTRTRMILLRERGCLWASPLRFLSKNSDTFITHPLGGGNNELIF